MTIDRIEVSASLKEVPEYSNLEDGFNSNSFFVVRGLNLPCDLEVCKQRAKSNDIEVFGYDKDGNIVSFKSSDVFNKFERGTLEINIVDAPFPVLLENEIPEVLLSAIKKSGTDPMLTLTKKGTYTPLHTDPDNGGGWMYLQSGIKRWQIIPAQYEHLFIGEGKTWYDRLKDPDKDYQSNFLYETVINAGDFIYFPENTLHRVWTYENSFGISGYAKINKQIQPL